MSAILIKYMKQYGDFSDDQMASILKGIEVQTYPKGTVLVEQGMISSTCYFVLSGCIRQFGVDEHGRETTYEFYTEEQSVVLFNQANMMKSSKYSLVCVEECVLVISGFTSDQEMYDAHEGLESMTRKMTEVMMGEVQEKNAVLISSSPEERYEILQDTRKDLFSRVPQHQLASYLGITAESFSRIKRRIDKSKLKMVD